MEIFNTNPAKATFETIASPFLSSEVIRFGTDNLFPNHTRNIVLHSITGQSCFNTLSRFLNGTGWQQYGDVAVNEEETLNDLLKQAAESLALYNGFAILCYFNALGGVYDMEVLDFTKVRRKNRDIDSTFLYKDWTKFASADNNETLEFENFNYRTSNKGAALLYVNSSNSDIYPFPSYFAAFDAMRTEAKCGKVALSLSKNKFSIQAIVELKTKFATALRAGEEFANSQQGRKIQGVVNTMQDALSNDNEGQYIAVVTDKEDEGVVIHPMENKQQIIDLTQTASYAAEDIHRAFNQDKILANTALAAGFSTDDIINSYKKYNFLTESNRQVIERAFVKIVSDSSFAKNIKSDTLKIEPLQWI